LLANLRESLAVVALIALLFCAFFWAGFFVGRSTVDTALPPPAAEPAVPVRLAAN
jgi:hypothetical protein